MTSIFKVECSTDEGETWRVLQGLSRYATKEAADAAQEDLSARFRNLQYRVIEVQPVVFKDSRNRVKPSVQRTTSYSQRTEAEMMWLRGDHETVIDRKVNH